MTPELKCAAWIAGVGLLACVIGLINEISLYRPHAHLRLVTVVVAVSMLVVAGIMVVHLIATGGVR